MRFGCMIIYYLANMLVTSIIIAIAISYNSLKTEIIKQSFSFKCAFITTTSDCDVIKNTQIKILAKYI